MARYYYFNGSSAAIFAEISLLGTTPYADVITSQALCSADYELGAHAQIRKKKASCSGSAVSLSLGQFFHAAKFYSHVMRRRFYFRVIKPLAVGIKYIDDSTNRACCCEIRARREREEATIAKKVTAAAVLGLIM
jgi:hypothetical protein